MDIIRKIDSLKESRGWSDYRLSTEAGLPSSTIANMHQRGTVPSVATLKAICNSFGITLAQFFSEDEESVCLNDEQRRLFDKWLTLTESQKQIIYDIINEFTQGQS